MAVLRAITELWQQLRIIPVVSAPGKPARWQLLKTRFQKAIAEGASTSQVTAISVLASIFLQAVIAAGMEEVEIFLSPLTARSKIREVLRGLVATRQVHTLSMGHTTQYYVAGTLPEFAPQPALYSVTVGSTYLSHLYPQEDTLPEPQSSPMPEKEALPQASNGNGAHRQSAKPARPHNSRPPAHAHDRKPSRPSSRTSSTSRTSSNSSRWQNGAAKSLNGSHHNGNGKHANSSGLGSGLGSGTSNSTDRNSAAWKKRNGSRPSPGQKAGSRTASRVRRPVSVSSRREVRTRRQNFPQLRSCRAREALRHDSQAGVEEARMTPEANSTGSQAPRRRDPYCRHRRAGWSRKKHHRAPSRAALRPAEP